MDFDHVGEKQKEISGLIFTHSTRRLVAEIDKCEVVCANCHRVRTYQRLTEEPGSELVEASVADSAHGVGARIEPERDVAQPG
jgi:hypothetical protein